MNTQPDGVSAMGAELDVELCMNCRFFTNKWHAHELGTGKCRRFPPVIDALQIIQANTNGYGEDGDDYAGDSSFFWAQPAVNPDGWCGEWKPSNAEAQRLPAD